MSAVSGLVDGALQISPFDFSFDTSNGQQENAQRRGQSDASQSIRFDTAVADAFSFSAEALQKAKVLQQNDAVFASESSQTQKEFEDAYSGNYDVLGRLRASEESTAKAPNAEDMRRVPYAGTPDVSSVAALYAGNMQIQDNLQTRTFTPSNGASAYEGMRLRSFDASRPVSVHINAAHSTALASGSTISPQKASSAYQVQADRGTPSVSMLPSSRWSVGIDMRV